MAKVRVGVIGCGVISETYLKTMQCFDYVEVVACADVVGERAEARAKQFGIPRACSPEELLADPAVEIVVNLTIPAAHGPVALDALTAGKSVHNEKPLAVDRETGQRLVSLAAEKGLRLGSAPDTFLGSALQTSRRLIDDGAIGVPVAATAIFANHGPERWHPNADFYYQPGAGPLFDMGPYYLTALVHLLGPIRRVTGSTAISDQARSIGSGPRQGEKISVNVPTHVAGVLDFASGVIGTLIMSFDVWAHELPRMEIYGSEGTLSVPANVCAGPVRVRRAGEEAWQEVSLTDGYTETMLGLGAVDMAQALRANRPHRTNGTLAYHVLDVMHACFDASRDGRHIDLASTCERPAPLPEGYGLGPLIS